MDTRTLKTKDPRFFFEPLTLTAFASLSVKLIALSIAHLLTPEISLAEGRRPASIPANCPDALVHYIPMTNQYFSAPSPIEDHSEEAFCFSHPLIERTIEKLKSMRPIRSQPNELLGRVLVIPKTGRKDAITLCQNGEITFQGKQYRLKRKFFEPAFIELREIAEQKLQQQRSRAVVQDTYFD